MLFTALYPQRLNGVMMKLLKWFAVCVCLLAICPVSVAASGAKTYIVLPFTVNGPAGYNYLEQAIPPMLSSRLHWAGNFEQTADGQSVKTAPQGEAEVKKIIASTGANYAVWGSVNILGEDCSLDVTVTGNDGSKWTRARETRVAQLIPVLSSVSDSISTEIFNRPALGAVAAQPAPARPHEQPAPAGTISEMREPGFMNPGIRYIGENDPNALRSQQLDFQALGMEICDAAGNGKNQVFLIDPYNIYAYVFENNRLRLLGKTRVALNNTNISIRSFDFGAGKPYIIITSIDHEQRPHSRIYSFNGAAFSLEMESHYFLNVITSIDTGKRILIGQPFDVYSMFKENALAEMVRVGKELQPGTPIRIGQDMKVYNFAYLPAGQDLAESNKIVTISDDEKLRVYTMSGTRLSESDEIYSGTPAAIEVNPTTRGMGNDTDSIRGKYYVPMRILVADLNKTGDYVAIINHPITSAGHFFRNYRSFLQSEVHALYWDGVGLSQNWRTRRVKGAIVDIAIADLNNDGRLGLITCINTTAGVSNIRTMLYGFVFSIKGAGMDEYTEFIHE